MPLQRASYHERDNLKASVESGFTAHTGSQTVVMDCPQTAPLEPVGMLVAREAEVVDTLKSICLRTSEGIAWPEFDTGEGCRAVHHMDLGTPVFSF